MHPSSYIAFLAATTKALPHWGPFGPIGALTIGLIEIVEKWQKNQGGGCRVEGFGHGWKMLGDQRTDE